jgi:hypothetical protein
MRHLRQVSLVLLTTFCLVPLVDAGRQDPQTTYPQDRERKDQDRRLPNGKSWSITIAKDEHERALKDADELISLAQQLKSELQKSGDYVVPLSTVKKTEDIEKMAKRIRGRLRG